MQDEIHNNTDNESATQSPHERQDITISLPQALYEQLRDKSAAENKNISILAEELIAFCLNQPKDVKINVDPTAFIPSAITNQSISQESQSTLTEVISGESENITTEMMRKYSGKLIALCLNQPKDVKVIEFFESLELNPSKVYLTVSIPSAAVNQSISQEKQIPLAEVDFRGGKSTTSETEINTINSPPFGESTENEAGNYLEFIVKEL
ncbi:MAG: hypothetical protein AAGG51_24685, partial [Cyanobacteria bacterium P01_G01_bin.54]